MKYKITSEEHAKLSDDAKAEYTEKDGAFFLNLEGHEEHLVPKAKRDLEVEHRKNAEKSLKEAQDREAKLLKDLEAAGDSKTKVEEIRKQHETEVARIKEEFAEKEKKAKAESHKAMIREEATRFAGDKFTVPSAISRLYQDRLTVEEVDGNPVIRVLEADGKPSVKSLADLQKEFLENEEFAPIVKASQGSGGGANPSKGGGANPKRTITKAELAKMSQEERHQAFVVDKATMAEE